MTDPAEIQATQAGEIARLVTLKPIYLADFLQQSNLVQQISANQLEYAAYHYWAEPLDKSLEKLLVNELNQLAVATVITTLDPRSKQADMELRVEFQQFLPSYQGNVLAKGQYWLVDKTQNEIKTDSFNYAIALEQDGYEHAVSRLQLAVASLAEDIAQALQQPEIN
jgi:uncharacterized lipoprotein YmbA